jgi:hypothetical protein
LIAANLPRNRGNDIANRGNFIANRGKMIVGEDDKKRKQADKQKITKITRQNQKIKAKY